MFQLCYKGDSWVSGMCNMCLRVFQGCFEEVLRDFTVVLGCFNGVSRVLQGCFNGVSGVYQWCVWGISLIFFLGISLVFLVCSRKLSLFLQGVSRLLQA